MNDPIIRVDNVHKSYLMGKEAVPALRGVTIDVARGEMLCLMGPSGSGKTTLLNLLGGLDEPGRGHITIDQQNIVALKEEAIARLRLEKMGFIFQTFNLLSNFTAFENVEAPMVLAGKLRDEDSLYRLGSRLFGIVLPNAGSTEAARIGVRVSEGLTDASGASDRFSFNVRVVNYPDEVASAYEMERIASAFPEEPAADV